MLRLSSAKIGALAICVALCVLSHAASADIILRSAGYGTDYDGYSSGAGATVGDSPKTVTEGDPSGAHATTISSVTQTGFQFAETPSHPKILLDENGRKGSSSTERLAITCVQL